VISVTVPVYIGLLIPTFVVRFCVTSLVDTVKLYVALLVIVSNCVRLCSWLSLFNSLHVRRYTLWYNYWQSNNRRLLVFLK